MNSKSSSSSYRCHFLISTITIKDQRLRERERERDRENSEKLNTFKES